VSEIRLEGISKRWGKKVALSSVSLTIPERRFTCLLGPPGAGKTTLLKILAGLVRPDAGQVFFAGRNVTKEPPRRRNVSIIAQDFALYPHMNVYQNIAYPLRLKRVPKDEIDRRVREVTAFLKIDHLLQRDPTQLSGGEQQRVAISRGLVKDADIYLFDEPLTNLDYKIREDMRAEFRRIQQETGQTIVYATSDSIEAISMSDHVVVLNQGHVVETGNTVEVYQSPAALFTASFFGYPPMNLFQVKYEQGRLRHPCFELPLSLDNLVSGRSYSLAVRPEHVGVSDEKPEADVVFQAQVHLVDVIGSDAIVYLRMGEFQIKAFVPKTAQLDIGKTVWVGLNKVHLFLYDSDSLHTDLCEVS
jgi:ABC-type sugar transport system ATPase subunit